MNVKNETKKWTSKVQYKCQISGSSNLVPIMFFGYLPPVNRLIPIGERPSEESAFPAELLFCPDSGLVQLGLVVNPEILFPPEYPYTSSTTKQLRDNFAELYKEVSSIIHLTSESLIVDIGSNDGNLLSNFKNNHRVLGVTPEDIGQKAIEKDIPTIIDYFSEQVVDTIIAGHGKAQVVTATNVFAHIDNADQVVKDILKLMDQDGIFISESHYLLSILNELQYDTIYHEHLRYYTLASIEFLLGKHGLEIFFAKRIPTHGGSIRVYAARKGQMPISDDLLGIVEEEKAALTGDNLRRFRKRVVQSKLDLYKLVSGIKRENDRVAGIGAPSRASTMVSYVGLDAEIIDFVAEVSGSHKIGHYMPGTRIPIVDESELFDKQPEYALLFSWHIAEELMPKIRAKGFKGRFIIPLPEPRVVESWEG
jgi:hypothetical protein